MLSCEYLGMSVEDFTLLAPFLPEKLYILNIKSTPKIKLSGLLPLLQRAKTFYLLRDSNNCTISKKVS